MTPPEEAPAPLGATPIMCAEHKGVAHRLDREATKELPAVGLPWLAALAALHAIGVDAITVHVTRPPRALMGIGALRVIQQKAIGAGQELTLAYEGYEERPKSDNGEAAR